VKSGGGRCCSGDTPLVSAKMKHLCRALLSLTESSCVGSYVCE
jgi:hypothetical protein